MPWSELAVVVRRQGAHLGGAAARARRRRRPARGPRDAACRSRRSRRRSRTCSRCGGWPRPDEREQLIESRADLGPGRAVAGRGARADPRGAGRRRHASRRRSTTRRGSRRRRPRRSSALREVLARRPRVADRSVLDAFSRAVARAPVLARGWWGRPDARPRGPRETSTRSSRLSSAVGRGGAAGDTSSQAFLESLDAGEHGPGLSAPAERRSRRGARADRARRRRSRVRHGRRGRRGRGELPQPVAPRADVRPRRRWNGRSRSPSATAPAWRTSAGCSGWCSGARGARVVLSASQTHGDGVGLGRRGSWTRSGVGVDPDPGRDRSTSRCRCARRRPPGAGRWPIWTRRAARRLAALEGSGRARRRSAALVVPAGMDGHRRPAARGHPGLVLAAVDARELRAAVRAVRGAGTRRPGRLPGVGGQDGAQDHRGLREGRRGTHAPRSHRRGRPSVAAAGVPLDGGLGGVAAPREEPDAAELVRPVRRAPGGRHRAGIRVRVRGGDHQRLHRPHRPGSVGVRHADHRLQDRRHVRGPEGEREPAAGHLLPRRAGGAGSAGGRADHGRRAGVLEGRVPHGRDRDARVGARDRRTRGRVPGADAPTSVRVARRAEAAGGGRAVSSPVTGRLLFLRLQDTLLAVPRGRARCSRWRVRERAHLSAGDRRRHGRSRADRGTVDGDLVAPRALRAGGRSGLGQDVGDGRARCVPGARGHGARGGRSRGRAARQRPVPDVHEQGHREPPASGSPGARRPLASPRARSPRSRTTTGSRRSCSIATACSPGSSPTSECSHRRSAPNCVRASWT